MPSNRAFSTSEAQKAFVVSVSTDLTHRYTDFRLEANQVVAEIRQGRPPRVVVDLGQVLLLTSVAIGAVVKIARESRSMGADVCLCNASDNVLNVLDTMNLTNLWPHFESLHDALASE